MRVRSRSVITDVFLPVYRSRSFCSRDADCGCDFPYSPCLSKFLSDSLPSDFNFPMGLRKVISFQFVQHFSSLRMEVPASKIFICQRFPHELVWKEYEHLQRNTRTARLIREPPLHGEPHALYQHQTMLSLMLLPLTAVSLNPEFIGIRNCDFLKFTPFPRKRD